MSKRSQHEMNLIYSVIFKSQSTSAADKSLTKNYGAGVL